MRIVIEPPNEKQKRFLQEKHKIVGFGGARGGGKSWAVRTKAKGLCFRYPGIKVVIIRKSYPELIANHIRQLRKELHGAVQYNDSRKEMAFPNGSMLFFRYCENEKDLERFQGNEFDVVFIDEATQFTETQFKDIAACVRGVNSFPKRIYLTCNPGGVGHAWVKRLLIDKQYKDGERAEDYAFIQSLVTDNKALMESDAEYVDWLRALPPKKRKAWLDGRWDIYEGQFFEEFTDDESHYQDRKWTNVIAPFLPPKGWQIYRSYDFGYAKPFSVGWWAVDFDGVVYRIHEFYGCTGEPNEGLKWNPAQQFQKIAEIEKTHPYLRGREIGGVADPSIWDASRGESVAQVAARYGIYFTPGDNERIAGWMQVHYRLSFDKDGYPQMYVFNTCKDFVRTIPALIYSEKRAEDLDTSMEDHIADETRYFCMSRPITPKRPMEDFVPQDDPLELGVNEYNFARMQQL